MGGQVGGCFRPAGAPGPRPQASPFMVRRPGAGRREPGGGEGGGAGGPRCSGLGGSGVGSEPSRRDAVAQVSRAGVGVPRPAVPPPWPRGTPVTAGSPGRSAPRPPPGPRPRSWGACGTGGGAVLPAPSLGHCPGWGKGCALPGAGAGGGWEAEAPAQRTASRTWNELKSPRRRGDPPAPARPPAGGRRGSAAPGPPSASPLRGGRAREGRRAAPPGPGSPPGAGQGRPWAVPKV